MENLETDIKVALYSELNRELLHKFNTDHYKIILIKRILFRLSEDK